MGFWLEVVSRGLSGRGTRLIRTIRLIQSVVLSLSQDQELWGMALWVENTHGSNAPAFIAEQIGRLAQKGEDGGVELWQEVAHRFEQLEQRSQLEN